MRLCAKEYSCNKHGEAVFQRIRFSENINAVWGLNEGRGWAELG